MTKVAVVTGASKGIGLAVVKDLLKNDFEVWGISRVRSEENLGENFHWVEFDLSQCDKISELTEQLPNRIDVLVNNAGVWELVQLKDVTDEHFNRTMNINFRAPVFLTKNLLSKLINNAVIINVSSEMGIVTEGDYGIYSASKAALDRFTTTLAKEWPDRMVVGILPASVDTPGAKRTYNYTTDSTRLTAEEVSRVMTQAVERKFASGSLVLVTNNECLPYWETWDIYTIINVDK